MKSKATIIVALVALMLTSCDQGYKRSKSTYFIQIFYNAEGTTLTAVVNESRQDIEVFINGEFYRRNSERHLELCEYFGDTNYNKYLPMGSGAIVFCDEFSAIDIVSDADFDAEHPAGTSLGNIAKIVGTSVAPFIESDYKKEFAWTTDAPEDFYGFRYSRRLPQYFPIDMLVSELQPKDLNLLEVPGFYLKFTKKPDAEKRHNMTVTLRTAEKVLTGTVEMVFE